MAKSLKVNYLLNLINTVAGVVFPLITFPYASRILQAEGIGIVNFYQSIISYISLVSCLGIPLYATREIAKVRENPSELSKRANEILFLHILLTALAYVVVVILCLTVPQIKKDIPLFLVLSSLLLFNAMGCDWFFKGTEDFKFITIRGLICRIIYIPLLFIFVKTRDDLLIYGLLTVGVQVGNNVFNIYRLTRLVRLRDMKEASRYPRRHLKGAVKIFLLSASTSLYLQVNVIILGFMANSTDVGYYTAANRIISIASGVIVALQSTLLPRMSALMASDDKEATRNTLNKVLSFLFCMGFPMVMGMNVMAPLIIKLFAGDSFFPSIPTLQILSFNMIVACFNGFLCTGILVPQGKEKEATIACFIGGLINIGANFALIPFFVQNGTAAAAILTELSVAFGMIILGRNYIPIKLWNMGFFKYIASSIVMWIGCNLLWDYVPHEAFRLTVIPISGVILYFISLWCLRDNFSREILTGLINRLIKKRQPI